MTIKEITEISDLYFLTSIANSYPKSSEETIQTNKQLEEELTEAGSNRHLYVAFENGSPVPGRVATEKGLCMKKQL